MRKTASLRGGWLLAATAVLCTLPTGALCRRPSVSIALDSATMLIDLGPRGRWVFPVGLGRTMDGLQTSPVGTYHTGRDPSDRTFYLAARHQPPFHRGLPFLRLDTGAVKDGEAVQPFGIHGPVTPTLIWGSISAGCVRMLPQQIRFLFDVARRHPRMTVRFVRHANWPTIAASVEGARRPDCPEAAIGVRRLQRLSRRSVHRDRVCGGVDHWYAVTLQSGDLLSASIVHDGGLGLELYGIRAISVVASGKSGLQFRVPRAARNRGARYLRVVAPKTAAPQPYALQIN